MVDLQGSGECNPSNLDIDSPFFMQSTAVARFARGNLVELVQIFLLPARGFSVLQAVSHAIKKINFLLELFNELMVIEGTREWIGHILVICLAGDTLSYILALSL